MQHCYDHPRPAVTVDIVLLRQSGSKVQILLIKRRRPPFEGTWALPGGFVDENESLEVAAARELKEETSIEGLDLEQIGAFGDPGRDPRGHTVSIVFGTFARNLELNAVAADDAEEAQWFDIDQPPPLAFDHARILAAAIDHFQN